MKVLFMLDSPLSFNSGIWWHRNETPSNALDKRGHAIKQVAIGLEVPPNLMEWPDTVVFGRIYPTHTDPVKIMRDYKKLGKRVIYDLDDDIWNVDKDNPSLLVSNAMKDQYEGMMKEADAFTTPSPVLAKKLKKHFKKPVFICPNGIDERVYLERPHEHSETLKIGYMGASSHWKDLQLITEALTKLSEKHDFLFTLYGITGEPLEAAIYNYNKMLHSNLTPERNAYYKSALEFYNQINGIRMWHVPFMPPELHPKTLGMCDLDIGLAPLESKDFNKCKSNVKFYEYASVGTVCLASDVEPYTEEVNYRAKNTPKDWYNKLEKLIVDKPFREKILKQQQDWVKKNRNLDSIGLAWELACQGKGIKGLTVANQQNEN